jgi:ArsR family transcriptional regulator
MENYKKKADLFHILSHPVRLQILDDLRKRQACVCHLQVVTGRPQAYVSQQLRILRDADLVMDDKDGQNVYYRLTCDLTRELLNVTMGQPGAPTHPEGCTCPLCTNEK